MRGPILDFIKMAKQDQGITSKTYWRYDNEGSGIDIVPFNMYATIPGGNWGAAAEVNLDAFNLDIQDSTTSEWNEYSEPGRADPKFMYGSYSRSVSISFTIVSVERDTHADTIRRLNSIGRMLKPVYRTSKGFNGVFCSIQIGRYIREDGMLTSFNVTPDPESPWSGGYPMVVNCDVELRVIEKVRPNFEEDNTGHFLGGKQGGAVREYYKKKK